jgi:hypothetical protein
MSENATPSLINVFEKETFSQSKKIRSLISVAGSCQMLKDLQQQRYITQKKCRSVDLRRKRMMKYYDLLSRSMWRHSEVTMEEFKDFLISLKSALDSLAQETRIVFLTKLGGTFNLYSFLEALKRENETFALNIEELCEKGAKDGWFEYFLNLRNPESHTGKITPSSYIVLRPVRDMTIKAVFKKIEGDIEDPSTEGLPQISSAKKNDAIQEVGLFLPDNPKETDPKKVTYNRRIKFGDYQVDLTRRINLLFRECYQEIGKELDKMENAIAKRRCQKTSCKNRYCRFNI